MSKKCCRSSPRCAGCPVRALAAARKHRELSETAALVTEILARRAPRPLPASVSAALEQFDELATRNGKTRAPAEDSEASHGPPQAVVMSITGPKALQATLFHFPS